jgi:hypothetical protein
MMTCQYEIHWLNRDWPVSERWFRILGNLGSGWGQHHAPECPHGGRRIEPNRYTRRGKEFLRRAEQFRRESDERRSL